MCVITFLSSLLGVFTVAAGLFWAFFFVVQKLARKQGDWVAFEYLGRARAMGFSAAVVSFLLYLLSKGVSFVLWGV